MQVANVVLPRPGGPSNRICPSGSPRLRAASTAMSSRSITSRWPTISLIRCGRRRGRIFLDWRRRPVRIGSRGILNPVLNDCYAREYNRMPDWRGIAVVSATVARCRRPWQAFQTVALPRTVGYLTNTRSNNNPPFHPNRLPRCRHETGSDCPRGIGSPRQGRQGPTRRPRLRDRAVPLSRLDRLPVLAGEEAAS